MDEPRNTTCWRTNSPRKRRITIIVAILLLLCVCMAVAIGILSDYSRTHDSVEINSAGNDSAKKTEVPSESVEGYETCMTATCTQSAANVLKNMNTNVDPCDNFYQFACGGFIKNTVLRDDQNLVMALTIIEENVRQQLRTSLEEPSVAAEARPLQLAKSLYKSCMTQTAIEAAGVVPLLDTLKKLGGWPVLEEDRWREETFDWIQSISNLKNMGYSPNKFLSCFIVVDEKNSTRHTLHLDEAKFRLGRQFLFNGVHDEKVKAYYSYMVDIAVMLGANRTIAEQQLESSLEFEIELAKISVLAEYRRDSTLIYHPMTITNLSTAYPTIRWKEYFNRLLHPYVRVDNSEIVIVANPSYINSMEDLINDTPKQVQANYVLWTVVADSVSFLNEQLQNRKLQYSTIFSGKTKMEPRWKQCMDSVESTMPVSIGAIYVRKYFHKEGKESVIEIADNIRKRFYQIIKDADWMNEETKKSALEKAAAIVNHIAYPEELLDDSKLEEYFQDLELSNDNFFQDIFKLKLFLINNSLKKLREPVDKDDWVDRALASQVNAFYAFRENSMILPAGILQGAYFHHDLPRYMNYGGIGWIIGHEIAHGFDNHAIEYDKDGNLVDWWSPTAKKRYNERAQCIRRQYDNYTVAGSNIDGFNTQAENIADNGGIKVAYLAYTDWAGDNNTEQVLPGLRYNPRQMFWISTANTWCSVMRPEYLENYIRTNHHSPPEFRILGMMSNMKEFADDFACPVSSKMNPALKCGVW